MGHSTWRSRALASIDVSSNRRIIPFAFLGALILGAILAPLDRSIRLELGQGSEVESLRHLDSQFGQGLSVAILGGYRSVAANLVWLAKNENWEQRDFGGTLAKIALATSIDPRPEMFWLNGSRIIANDMPAWEVGDHNTDILFQSPEGRAIVRDFGKRALAFLEGSRPYHARNSDILLEEGMIYWRKLEDLEAASQRILEATLGENPPYHAFRLYGEILTRMGRKEEALQFLERHYLSLPDNSYDAMKVVVADRIRALREELESKEN